jgi:pimeloyl-ACP methyl ester carboxylesterase
MPSLALFLSEPGRSTAEFFAFPLAAPWLTWAPRGDGHPVLVLPGLLATDASTVLLRGFIRRLGYPVRGWQLGRNFGPTSVVHEGLPATLEHLTQHYNEPATLVGWSLGGIYARELARETPELVRQVITLASPFGMTDPRQSRAQPAFDRYAHRHVRRMKGEDAFTREPLLVPATAIYSRSDGIVAWQTCRETPGPRRENIVVRGSHLGFGYNPAVLWAIADRLAQDPEQWKPFRAPKVLRAFYPARDNPAS